LFSLSMHVHLHVHPKEFLFLDPAKQFALVGQHISMIRQLPGKAASPIVIYVERNLGFEAGEFGFVFLYTLWLTFPTEHHKRALEHIPGVSFYLDQKASRVGVLTTEAIKHAMVQLVVVMLQERRIHIHKPLVSKDEKGLLLRFREQLEVYSYQFKIGSNTFQRDRVVLSGKVGGMKDDIAIAFQLACYFTNLETQRAGVLG